MKNKIIYTVLSLTMIATLVGCKKNDLPLSGDIVKERQAVLEQDIKKMLQNGDYGFSLYPESSSTSSVITKSSNFTLKFDTVNNQVTMSSSISRYSAASTSYFTLSAGTGLPLLAFSTNSYISQIYTTGDKGITDYFFRVIKLVGDTIKVQSYRKGTNYASEGGPVFNLVKIVPSIDIPARSSYDTISVVMTRFLDNSVILKNPIKFGAGLNIDSYSSAVPVELVADESLIGAYNSLNKTNYKVFPNGTYDLVNNKLEIPANTKYSTANFEVNIKNTSSFEAGTDYILPVKATAQAPFIVGGKSVAYIVLQLSNINPSNALVSGNLIDRTGWSVSASGSYSANPVARVLDGDNTGSTTGTAWSSEGGIPAWLQLDMGASKTVKGFRLKPSYEYRTENWLTATVSSSADGINWKYVGVYNGSATSASSTSANPDIKHLTFINPVTARYFKFTITRTNGGTYTGLSEINAVE